VGPSRRIYPLRSVVIVPQSLQPETTTGSSWLQGINGRPRDSFPRHPFPNPPLRSTASQLRSRLWCSSRPLCLGHQLVCPLRGGPRPPWREPAHPVVDLRATRNLEPAEDPHAIAYRLAESITSKITTVALQKVGTDSCRGTGRGSAMAGNVA
jgi:hypothetical protein